MSSIVLRTLYVACFFIPQLAFAHSPIEGMDNFYNGVLHPLLVPAHVLLLIIFGLYVNQKGRDQVSPIGLFILAIIPGLIASWFNVFESLEWMLLMVSVIVGILTASNAVISSYLPKVVAVLVGVLIGADSTQTALVGAERLTFFLGCGLGMILIVILSWGLGDYARSFAWMRVGVRVIGSWIAASAILVLVLAMHGPQ